MDFEELKTMRNRRVNISVSIPMSLIEVIDRLSDAESRSASDVLERLLRKGLRIERDERERAQKAS